MAKAEKSVERETKTVVTETDVIVLTLSPNEARAVRTLCGAVGGCDKGTGVRDDIDSVWNALRHLGVKSLPRAYFTSLLVSVAPYEA
jgi:hypothetical protein